ncbi:MAG: acyltransferase [Ignavibacteria bacterium]|nr:acyltransferase [Ignavibacteria bacterium]MBI3766505.1 acyltransferase [Ignavibacteriales bacterium]
MKFTIALAQVDNVLGDLHRNIKHHLDFVRRAKDGGADLVVFPELSLSGYSIRDINWEVAIRPDDEKLLAELIKESREISILLGCVEESKEYNIHNAAFLFEKGSVRSVHRKIYPPTYGMFEELRYFSPGGSVRAVDANVGRLGVLICEDLWHLPLPYILAQDGAQVIIGMSASPTRLTGEKAIQIAKINSEQHRAFARLLSSYVIFCNRVGFEDGVNFWGGSEIVGPDGEVIVQAKLFEEDLVFAEIDGNEVRRARRFSRHFLDDDVRLVIAELERVSRRDKG